MSRKGQSVTDSATVAPTKSGEAINVVGVNVTYQSRDGGQVVAVDNVNVRVESGEFVVAVGPSGCGKSTLLKCIAGLVRPSVGEIVIGDDAVTSPRNDIGVMFQTPVLLPWRTTLQNVLLSVEAIQGKKPTDEQRARARRMLDIVGLGAFADKYPWELSGGMQQRAALARTLLPKPSVLLMDEPFGALDEFNRERLNLELLDVWQQMGQTVVLVTHSIDEAVFLADRVLVMEARPGRVTAEERIELPRPRTREMIGSDVFSRHVRDVRASLRLAQ